MHLEGRNEISRILAQQGLHISEGSVGNIVRAYRKHEQSLQSDTSGIEQVNPKIVTSRDGGPLSHFLGEDTSTDEEVIPSVTSYSNSPSPAVPTPPKPFSESKPRDLFIKDPDLEEESEQMRVLSPEEIENSKPKVRDTSESIEKAEAETLFTETKGLSMPVEERLEQEKVAWDYYGPTWMKVLKQIRREKDQRRHELSVIDRRKQKLSEWKKRLNKCSII